MAFNLYEIMSGDKKCQVRDCNEESHKTVPADLASKVVSFDSKLTKVHLCKEHYKKYKKGTKKEREVLRSNWD
ncbi:MAG: hypothetical protein ACYCUZ_05945 [Cuniculiplasma sp.]